MSLQTYEKPNYFNTINNDGVIIDSTITAYTIGDAYNSSKLKTVFTAGASGAIIDKFSLASTNASTLIVYILTYDGSVLKFKKAISVAANSGTDGTVAIADVLSSSNSPELPIDSNGKRYMRVKPNHTIVIGVAAAPASGKFLFGDISGMDK
jgi:hypothetical protein